MLLSKIPGNRTIGFQRSNKGKRSTRSKLYVDPGFASFDKLRGRGFSLLVFYSHFKCFFDVSVDLRP